MTTITTMSKVTHALVLLTGLVAASTVWSKDCPEAAAAAPSSAAQALAPVGRPSPADVYAVLHDVALNQKDGLGNYDDDYKARYPK